MTWAPRVIWLVVALWFFAPNADAAEVLTNETIVTLVKAGLGEEVILSKIQLSQGQYDVSTAALLRLKTDGVSERIIKAMLDTSAKPAPAEPKTPEGAASSGRELANEQKAIALYRQGKAVEAAAEFDKLIAEKPGEAGPKIWKALAQLEQARVMRESRSGPYRPLVLGAWAALQGVEKVQPPTPEWNLAVGKALWLNERRDRGKRFVEKALTLRSDYAEAHLLLGDMAYDEWVTSSSADTTTRWRIASATRKQYEAAMALPDLPSELRAEALFKLGMVSAELEGKKKDARACWERAAADPTSRYGRLAQEKLRALPAE